MIEDTKHNSEGTFAKFLDNFVPEAEMLIVSMNVLLLVTVEAVVCRRVNLSVTCPSWQVVIASILDPFIDIEEVDDFIVHDLAFLALP